MNSLDYKQRAQALDISKSFIVQAPAGSGKTSLLVQRYLALLSAAQYPEEIIAITFTRKAAGEMRDRIIAALLKAQNISPSEISNLKIHYLRTLKLAQKVLIHNQKNQWNLLENPHRLRIQTIDSLCNYLSKQLPVLAGFNGYAEIAKDHEATDYYQKAAHAILQNLADPNLDQALKKLLLHLDNDIRKVEGLLVEMLKRREQWLPYVFQNHERETLEQALANINHEILEKLESSFSYEYLPKIKELIWFSGNNLKLNKKFNHISQLIDFKGFFSDIKALPKQQPIFWHALAELLLTDKFQWRKKFGINLGFPPKSAGKTKQEKNLFAEMKSQMEQLLQNISSHVKGEMLRQNLQELAEAPASEYTDQEWEIICAQLKILPTLVAQLTVFFNAAGIADYAEIAMAADRALGDINDPTDLALNLDYQIKHILIDEFQDTSIAQLRLIEKLTAGWQEEDGRTLFLVGDPMQSIYRFRQAEVGLFLRAQHEGIGSITLTPITLQTNFRATPKLINWLNENFNKILPAIPDINYGAVNFTKAYADPEKPLSQTQAVTIQILENGDDVIEAQQILKIVKKLRDHNPDETIAILGRTRTHLAQILIQLKNANIPYQAQELKTLTESPIIQDLFALTCALLHIADKTAWLAILRAPWCGLQLKDLLIIANSRKKTVFENINSSSIISQLSEDGQKRLVHFINIVKISLKMQRLLNLKNHIYQTWLALNGPACTINEDELENAENYFKLLENFANQNFKISQLNLLGETLQNLYASTNNEAKLQIMTIHKAKGLEFDHVIIPALDKTTKNNPNQLLMWMERPRLHGGSDLLIAPIKAYADKENSIFKFLRSYEQKKDYYELGRLLYVAATRAKQSVFISGQIKIDDEQNTRSPEKGSLLKQLWPCFNEEWITKNFIAPDFDFKTTQNNQQLKLRRIKSIVQIESQKSKPKEYNPNCTPSFIFKLQDFSNAYLGTVIHKALADLCQNNIKILSAKYIEAQKLYWKRWLLQLGCHTNLEEYLQTVIIAVTNILTDQRGQWIIDNQHQDAYSEFAITTIIDNEATNFIIDRTFVDKDTRWIIDYKTSVPQSAAAIETFVRQEQQIYQQQLSQYAKAIQQIDQRLIRLGLYFPLCKLWREILPN